MPRRPSEPNKYLPAVKEHVSIYDGSRLSDILAAAEGIAPSEVRFKSTCGYYDDYDYQFEWDGKPRLNPRYEKEMIVYEKRMSAYRQAMEIYQSDLREYRALNKQYMKWFHENELKKLG
jgi:hypothetical protein